MKTGRRSRTTLTSLKIKLTENNAHNWLAVGLIEGLKWGLLSDSMTMVSVINATRIYSFDIIKLNNNERKRL